MTLAFVAAAALPCSNTTRRPAACGQRAASVRMDAGAPPESRVAPYYPKKGRFEAPYLSFQNVPEFELMNKIGLVMEEVPLDLETAAAILKVACPAYVKETCDFARLFSSDVEDPSAESEVDRYFPPARRYEVPVIEIEGKSELDGKVTIAVGTIVPDPVDDDPAAATEEADAARRTGEFWKTSVAPGAKDTVERNFGTVIRNEAPVIEFQSLGVSCAMEEITGQPPAGPFEDRYMLAPRIRIKAPMGEWDSSAFVEVSCEEVQLPILNALK